MAGEKPARRSMYEDLVEKTERRRSFFDKTAVSSQDKESDSVRQEWNSRWGKCNLDYVNVVKYPEEYVQKLREEKELWLKGLHNIAKRIEIVDKESQSEFLITEEILTTEQKTSLGIIDSKINEYIKKSTTFLRDFELYKRTLEAKLEKIERERKMIEMMTVTKK